jgi:hypothetical protein
VVAFCDDGHCGCVEEDRALEDTFEQLSLARLGDIELDAQRPPVSGQIRTENAQQDTSRGGAMLSYPVRPARAKR